MKKLFLGLVVLLFLAGTAGLVFAVGAQDDGVKLDHFNELNIVGGGNPSVVGTVLSIDMGVVGDDIAVTGDLTVVGDTDLTGSLIQGGGTIEFTTADFDVIGSTHVTGASSFDANLDVGAGLDLVGSFGFTTTLLGSSTGSVGWGTVSFANQACNTGCVTACVFGWDDSAGIVNCTDATADNCLCAGAN